MAPSGRAVSVVDAPPPINVPVYEQCLSDGSYLPSTTPISAYVSGWSNASKLGNAAIVGYPAPALAESSDGFQEGGFEASSGDHYNCLRAITELSYQGQREFPSTTVAFLAFGFIPVTATVDIVQSGAEPLTSIIFTDTSTPLSSIGPDTVVTTSQVILRISSLKLNGVPLNVGSICQTGMLTSPGNPIGYDGLVLSGGSDIGDPGPHYGINFGGEIVGSADIPPFTGCVTPTGENLDALLTSSVSGPGYIALDQGPPCFEGSSTNCTAGLGSAPAYQPQVTVTNGGSYSASSSLMIALTLLSGPTVPHIACNATISGAMPDTDGPPRTATASIGLVFTGCADQNGNAWTMTQQETPELDFYSDSSGTLSGNIWNVAWRLNGPNNCVAQLGGIIPVKYINGVLTLQSGDLRLISRTTGCPASTTPRITGAPFGAALTYTISPPIDIAIP